MKREFYNVYIFDGDLRSKYIMYILQVFSAQIT
jgi:hypothetical protein